ncbi:telomere silencing Zds1 protein [Rutstroemia sp. NJR-2017a BVV2]|nr:telomere silencing Zds1 protein [Rutstroemia sp. NJR-2017a BVV2]
MKTSSRPREIGGSFASRRGHGAQLSISDTNHHVTEAIGDMYGEDEYSRRDSRPLSFLPSTESIETTSPYNDSNNNNTKTRPPLLTNGNTGQKAHTSPAIMQSPRSPSFGDGALSPTLSLRDPNAGGTANAEFPLNDIDYESNPAAVAQELSNLQALRRMSMDVGHTSDPDLPSFQGVSLMPTVAPTGDDDEDDPSRLFWVPARVHPELAPMEFKTFLENRVQSIKRRSGDQNSLSVNGPDQNGSGMGLRRKKSMLSRQIDNSGGRGAVGYQDGAEQLERKKSLSSHHAPELRIADLQELDALVRDPSKAMQKLTIDTGNGGGEVPFAEDLPILPQAPGIGLRRSTRTTYRKGSLRKGERVPFSKRAGTIRAETDGEESPTASPIDGRPSVGYPLTKVQSEPPTSTENFSRPNRSTRRMQNIEQDDPPPVPPIPNPEDLAANLPTRSRSPPSVPAAEPISLPTQHSPQPSHSAESRSISNTHVEQPVPQIVETPPPPEVSDSPTTKQSFQYPERTSSQTPPPAAQKQSTPQVTPEPPARSSKRPVLDRQASSGGASLPRVATMNDLQQQSSQLQVNNTRNDAPTLISTIDDRKPEKKGKKDREEESSGTRKTSWGWFKGSDEKEKKDKKKDDKSKSKASSEKMHDNARLDVLQSTMETTTRGRESFLIERDNFENKLQDERKKESSRKSGGENKKEKDGIFSSLFGGGKKKSDRDSGGKKGTSLRTLSPDPPHRILKPDIDYNWTRFSIMEERAIYRMAHIKLANPKRALYSQGITQYAESSQNPNHATEGVNYIDDSQIYDYDHQDDDAHGQGHNRPQSRTGQHNSESGYNDQNQQYSQNGNEYYDYGRASHDEGPEDDEMW